MYVEPLPPADELAPLVPLVDPVPDVDPEALEPDAPDDDPDPVIAFVRTNRSLPPDRELELPDVEPVVPEADPLPDVPLPPLIWSAGLRHPVTVIV